MNGVLLGYDVLTDAPIYLPEDAGRRSTYIIGQQGAGKTELLKRMALAYIELGHGVAVMSPHADLLEELLMLIPEAYWEKVIYFAPFDRRPVGLNVFGWQPTSGLLLDKVADEVVTDVFKLLWADFYGPRMDELISVVARTTLYAQTLPEEERPTLCEFADVIGRGDDWHYRQYLLDHIKEHHSRAAVKNILKYWAWLDEQSPRFREEIITSTITKARLFKTNELVAQTIGQGHLTHWDEHDVMDEGKILLVNLDVNALGTGNCELLAKLLISRLYLAATSRKKPEPGKQRIPFHLLVDELGYFATPKFAHVADFLRKYAVDICTAHQRRGQLETQTRDATLTAGNWIAFTVNPKDAGELAEGFDSTPPGPELRGEKQGLVLVTNPWDSLEKGSHEDPWVNDLYHSIAIWLTIQSTWDLCPLLCPKLGLPPEMVNFTIYGFPDQSHRDRFLRMLNQVLYLMMTDAPGESIETWFLALGRWLFAYKPEALGYRETWVWADSRKLDPPLGSDWGLRATQQAGMKLKTHILKRQLQAGEALNREIRQELAELTKSFARTYTRREVLTKIGKLGALLKQNGIYTRAGQPEPDYETQRPYHDVTNEWANELSHLPKFHAWVKIHGVGEFKIKTIKGPELPADGEERAERLRQLSREKYGVDRQLIEKAILQRTDMDWLTGGETGGVPASGPPPAED